MKLVALAMTVLAAGATPTIDAFFAEFAAKRDHIDRLRSRFIQETITPDETTRALGFIVYERPRRILIRYLDPEVAYLVEGTRVYQYNADLEQVQIYDLDDDPQLEALFLGFNEETSRLREAYTVGIFDPDPSACGTKGLRLTPALVRNERGEDRPASDEAPLFEEVKLLLSDEDYLPCRIHIVNDADSQVEMAVEDFTINEAAVDAAAQIEVPEGTTIIENEKLVETVGPGGKRIPESPAVSSRDLSSTNPSPEPAADGAARP